MTLRATVEISRKTRQTMMGPMPSVHSVEYRLSINPFRLLHRHDLPASHELEDWETEDDVWFRKDGQLYNVKEFCKIGMPIIPGPHGGAQMASNGYFAIAAFEGKIYGVSIQESKTYGHDELK